MDFVKARYWRAVIIGATTTEDNSWRVFVIVAVNVLAIILFVSIATMEPDRTHWRVYASWGIVVLSILVLPLNVISTQSYIRRHQIDLNQIEPKFRKVPDLGKEIRIGLLAVLVGPPIIRYILDLIGIDL